MTISVQNNISEIEICHIQNLFKEKDPLKRVDIVFENIFNLDINKFADYDRALAYKQWFENTVIEQEEAPLSFKINKRVFHSCYLDLDEIEIETPLSMNLSTLIELANLKIDHNKYKGFDNVAALIYREDWSKPFDQKEYLKNALFFNKQKTKYSIWGVQKMNELFKVLKETYPILYDSVEDSGKTDGRKMTDLLNIVSGDNPSLYRESRQTPISDVFVWMEQKKIDYLNNKLNN